MEGRRFNCYRASSFLRQSYRDMARTFLSRIIH